MSPLKSTPAVGRCNLGGIPHRQDDIQCDDLFAGDSLRRAASPFSPALLPLQIFPSWTVAALDLILSSLSPRLRLLSRFPPSLRLPIQSPCFIRRMVSI